MHPHYLGSKNVLDTETNPVFLLMYVTGLWLMLPGLMVYFLLRSLHYGVLMLGNELFKAFHRPLVG
ncbi:MAG TPA: hypothetical protein V6D07_18370 [Trichocoleus sp.]